MAQKGYPVKQERDLIHEPLTEEEVRQLVAEAGGIDALISRKSPKYKELSGTITTPEGWIAAMVGEPRLIRRPLWRSPKGLLVGFDEGKWLAALD